MPTKKIILAFIAAHLLSLNAVHADENESAVLPDSISDIYSDVDMRMRLAAKPNAAPCVAESCNFNQEFDARVQQLGAQLSTSAYTVYPAIKKRVPQFTFSVADKKESGTASNGAGTIVLFRGLQEMQLSDDALGFVMAREMGHVIGKHHVSNTSTKLIISALATLLFPAVAILGASSAAAQASTATTLLTSAASTATSMLGSEVALARTKPTQLAESDEIALNLMQHQSWDLRSTASILQFDDLGTTSPQNGWMQDLNISKAQLQKMVAAEDFAIIPLQDSDLSEAAEPAATIGLTIEDVDSSLDSISDTTPDSTPDLSELEQGLPSTESAPETEIELSTNTNADVVLEAIHQ